MKFKREKGKFIFEKNMKKRLLFVGECMFPDNL